MRVTDVEVIHVRAPMRAPSGPAGVFSDHREALLVRITAADGTVGWGETYALPGTREVLELLAAGLIGAETQVSWPRPAGLDEVGSSLAVGAVDIAWHDLVGRCVGVPVHTLLGGATRTRVTAYASGFLYQQDRHPAEVWPEELEAAVARGFRVVKVRLGMFPPTVELPLLERLVRSAPDGVSVVVDAWGSYPPAVALQVGQRLAELGIGWFEEPTNLGYPELAAKLSVPVAGGEMGRTRQDFARWISDRTYDVLQPDVAICGGLGVARFVAELSALHGIRCVPHTWNGPIMAAASLHLAATLPWSARVDDGVVMAEGPMLEYDTSDNPLICGLLRRPLEVRDGQVAVPQDPGLGIDVDEDAVERYRVR